LSPFQTNIGLTSTLEQLGQSPLDSGAQLGGRSATAGANVGQSLLAGGAAAARTAQAAGNYNPWSTLFTSAASNPQLTKGLANWMNPYGGTAQGAYGQQDQYLSGAYANPQTQQAQMLADQNSWFQ
jgi:hypothetical protein